MSEVSRCRAFAECGRRAGLNPRSSVESLDVIYHRDLTRLELQKAPSGHRVKVIKEAKRTWSYKLVRGLGPLCRKH